MNECTPPMEPTCTHSLFFTSFHEGHHGGGARTLLARRLSFRRRSPECSPSPLLDLRLLPLRPIRCGLTDDVCACSKSVSERFSSSPLRAPASTWSSLLFVADVDGTVDGEQPSSASPAVDDVAVSHTDSPRSPPALLGGRICPSLPYSSVLSVLPLSLRTCLCSPCSLYRRVASV